ncbi:DUF1176 domain-containing protein [Aureimonas fodinaquatilis]|uniref:DUF1176 domain-containing protein n=1 Tax=Aureimonas fodinaquatilis TaxID=2565783 RepID=A0A5B0DNU0_9HYPH|nr:DUF1176 domain-containing protein [Aureimonas fodinaquatilis]KAA0968148.1 DUF1176 domain-containing protein [Aureimonas fodinaquatilis]
MRLIMMLVLTGLLVFPGTAQEGNWQADAIERAILFHKENLPEGCQALDNADLQPAHFELQVGEETAARQALMIEFPCRIGAYNMTSVFLLSDQHGKVTEPFFPSPQIKVVYEDETESTIVDDIIITGTENLREVVNATFDSSTRSVTERNKWRGLGDAYSVTKWGYKQGKFEIMYFAVDASFDGEDNPKTLMDIDIW